MENKINQNNIESEAHMGFSVSPEAKKAAEQIAQEVFDNGPQEIPDSDGLVLVQHGTAGYYERLDNITIFKFPIRITIRNKTNNEPQLERFYICTA